VQLKGATTANVSRNATTPVTDGQKARGLLRTGARAMSVNPRTRNGHPMLKMPTRPNSTSSPAKSQ
jgi:hypothetical protein